VPAAPHSVSTSTITIGARAITFRLLRSGGSIGASTARTRSSRMMGVVMASVLRA
jgi:hypothetical protein